jgi:hypothetical protein
MEVSSPRSVKQEKAQKFWPEMIAPIEAASLPLA